uniref:Uncharacterized protein n=1 Tax=Salix viminalis TaxID=40686 RepID=A0A6N2N689_SALVM
MRLDLFVIDANNLGFLLITKPHPTLSGSLVLVIGSALVALTTIMHHEKSARSVGNQRRWQQCQQLQCLECLSQLMHIIMPGALEDQTKG